MQNARLQNYIKNYEFKKMASRKISLTYLLIDLFIYFFHIKFFNKVLRNVTYLF